MGRAKKVKRAAVAAETAGQLAAAFAEWRGAGMPGFGFADGFKARVKAAAKAAGRSYADFWAEVHREAYRIIDADPRVF